MIRPTAGSSGNFSTSSRVAVSTLGSTLPANGRFEAIHASRFPTAGAGSSF
jgi:hypothetical protein